MDQNILDRLRIAVIEREFKATEGLARDAIEKGIEPLDILNGALLKGIEVVGRDFKEQEIFLPELIMSVRAYDNAFKAIQPLLIEGSYQAKGKVAIGTITGDLHDIGKNIVGALIQGNGFDVIDLGVDVKKERFIEAAMEVGVDVIAISALLSTTMNDMRGVLDGMEKEGIRDKFKVIVGGAPITQSFADEIGADGYGEDAQSAVELVKELLKGSAP